MERFELLARLGFAPPEACRMRVIIDTDAKNEGDDDFAILHHLLTPQFDVRGICATHFEVKTTQRGLPPHSMERSYQEVCRLLNAAHIDDVPVLHGCTAPLASPEDAPDCEAVEFLIQEALRDDPAPLYIAAQGAVTNIAAALNRAPEIASRMTAAPIPPDDRNSMFSKIPSPAVSCWTALSRSGRSHRMSTPDSRYPFPNWRFGYGPAAKWEPIYFSS